MTADAPTPDAPPVKPPSSAQLRRDIAETKRLVAAIPPQPDHDLVVLTAVGETVADILGRPVHWAPAGLAGHTHVAVPVADLVELLRKIDRTGDAACRLIAAGAAVLRAMGYTGRDGANPYPHPPVTPAAVVEIETPEESTP